MPLRPDELAEARVRLAVGLKRYFHGKRMEGLLSSRVRAPHGRHWSAMPAVCHGLGAMQL